MNVVRLVDRTDEGHHWGAKDVLKSALAELERGDIPHDCRIIVLHISKDNQTVGFVQNGLCDFSILGLLEYAKLNIYRKFIAKD